ncbi:protein-export membrane protein SecF [Ruminiclostridium papyrosolvens DSM 2782]|uniref:Protein-export membrane protein SecF n=1 Tax=Ruminiclostridium papyrosolvens DSM 2782 TaxID=588581 RepID=F1THB4_9FIRM|nr:protein translocase subunit SecF [Ruminiclostridium papyrosolvens]EGD46117.1 protein-export membrane protein SecF [Ruminiclostridium papyrosolvens DSM 2782]WES35902.1 protein translocase subunit SecF [Ruminiclostridium papyrosolvens DSM 2782]
MVNLYAKRYYFFILSAIIILSGVAMYLVEGFKLDIEFEGGTIIEMRANDKMFTEKNTQDLQTQIADFVTKTLNKPAKVQKSTSYDVNGANAKSFDIIKISIGSQDTLSNTELTKVEEAVVKEFKLNAKDAVVSEESVEPFIGKEIMNNGLKAIVIAFVLIILYVWYRFKAMSGLSAGVFAVVGVIHDVLVMLSVYVIFQIPLNESFIAAMLTVVGYSMNDTVIIYDRIRENNRLLRKVPLPELVNSSIIQTLNRSINTVVTSLIAITTVYIFSKINGINSMEQFSFPLIVGITAGCYSSIFIASPLYVMWKESQKKKKISGKPAKA